MTNDELIKWAQLEGKPEIRAELDALIWIAQKKARMEVWEMISKATKQNHDMESCESYPGGFLKRRKNKNFGSAPVIG